MLFRSYAFALHGKLRATKDVDIFVGTDLDNARRVFRALQAFGAPLESLREQDLTAADTFFIMGREPNQIDIITTIDGVTFEQAWENRVPACYAGETVYFIGKDDLITNKRAAGRPQDLADIDYLEGNQGRSSL